MPIPIIILSTVVLSDTFICKNTEQENAPRGKNAKRNVLEPRIGQRDVRMRLTNNFVKPDPVAHSLQRS